jgi:hypothetical protein
MDPRPIRLVNQFRCSCAFNCIGPRCADRVQESNPRAQGHSAVRSLEAYFFFNFGLFNQYLRNKSSKKVFFLNLALLSRVSPFGMTYQ